MAATSKPNSVTDKIVVEQIEVKPRAGGSVLADAAVKSGKPAGQVKRKKDEEDELQNLKDDVGATAEDVAGELVDGQEGPILLAQAETSGASATASGGGATGTGAAAGSAAGAEAAGAVALSDAALGTIILGGVVGVAVIASTGGAAAVAAVAAPTVTGFTLSGIIALGKINDATGLVIEAFKADGTLLAGGTGTVNNDGTYTISVTENYSGPVLIRLKDTNTGTNYIDEGTGAAADLATDLRVMVNVSGSGGATIPVMLTPLTELAVRELKGDSGGDGGTAATVLGATVTTTQVTAANDAIKTALGLTGDIVTTTPVTVDDAAFATSTNTAAKTYGQVLAAIAGAEVTTGQSTGTVLNTLAQGISGSTLDQAVIDLLITGATIADSVAGNATGTATALTTAIGSNISAIDISADTGSTTDFITQTAAQTITATLDAALTGTKLWGSVDGGTTWTDISSFVTTTSLSWTGVTLSGSSSIKLAVTASTVTAFTGATASVIGDISTQSYSVDAAAPTFTSATAANFAENGTATAYTAAATDAHLLTYTKSGVDAALFNLDPNSGAVTFISAPNFEAPGSAASSNVYDITVTATDGAGNASSQAVAITVTDANEMPTLTSGTAASFAENATGTVYTATATDPDAGAALTYALAGADAARFNINASTGAVTFAASPNFEAPTDTGTNNVSDITVTASDGTNTTAAQAVAITVTNVNEMPTLTSSAAASFAENGTGTVYTVAATDQDAGTTLTYALAGTDAALFNINASTGAVTFATAPNFEVPTDTGTNNVYDITVTASDGTLTTAAQAVAITVTNVNEAPALTSGATSTATLAVNQAFSNDASGLFSDVDAGNVFSYSATGLPAGITLNSTTGVISGTPTATGTANIVLTATDSGGLTASHTVTVNVVTAPVITSIASNVAQAKSGDALTFTATISEAVTVSGIPTLTLDVGGTTVTATYTGGTGTAALTFTATTPAGDDATVTVTAINLNGGSVTGNVTTQPLVTTTTGQVVTAFVVDNSNPVFTSAATANAAENQTAAYASATTDGTAVTYTLGGTDAGLFNISASTGAVTFATAPNFEVPTDTGGNNVYDITVTATDALGHATNQAVAITVTNANEAPTLTSGATSTQTLAVNQPFSSNVSGLFSDVDVALSGDVLSYSATGLPTGITLDSTSGVISGTPTATGTANIVLTATDSGGLTASHTVTVSVVSAPTITNTATLDGVTNLDVRSELVLTFSDTIALGSGQIRVMDDMGTAGWTLTNTTTAESKQDVTNNDVVITLANGAVTGLTIGGVDKSAEMAGSVSVSGTKLIITPAGSDDASATDWDFDWDFGANYHVELDAGVVTNAGGIGNVALTDPTTLNFTTVTPLGDATGAASQKMAADGTLTAGYTWHHGHVSDATQTGFAMDFTTGSHALVLQSNGLDVPVATPLTDKSSTNIGGKVLLSGFGTNDAIYMDNGGDMSLASTDGHKGAGYIGSGNSNARVLDNLDGGTQLQTVFADYASTTWTAITALGGADLMLENASHYNANLVICG